ncbi:MAG: hypothetical protein ACREHG_02540 [Candidatus Saccharimonadales bacterium]
MSPLIISSILQWQAVIKVEAAALAEKSHDRSNSRKFINGDLPVGCEKGNAWRRNYIPTYITLVAASEDPWFVEDEHAVEQMQEAWDVIYLNGTTGDNIPHTVELNQAVFCIVSPLHLSELTTNCI